MEDYRLEQTGQEVQRILNGAAMEANLQAEVERATDAEGTLQENIDAEAQARQDADSLLQQGIDDEAQRAKDAEEANAGEIESIKALIPSTATPANKLADTNYVNSSIQTATAEYRGDYNVVTDLHLAIDATHAQIETLLPTVIAEADKNDYCYVMIPTNAQTPTEIAKIERYKMTSEGWKFEYDVNNSTFTAEEWAAIKSGITSGLVGKLNALPTNADLLLLLAGKQDVLTFDSVPVPESNNPVKSGGVYSAIDDEKTARLNSDTAIHAELDGLQAKVPATASSDNKLVDQNQMNSSISTATATFRGDWNVVSDLHLAVDATRAQIAALLPTVIATADNNDYCYVEIPTSAETPTQIERVERYKFNGTAWAYEYTLNNSGFTADQWAAINSMITSGLVAKLSALPTNADLLAMLAQKQNVLTFDSTPTENSQNPVTSGGVFAADKALSDAIEAILLLIPSAASSLNKLVDTALMNSSISTATATFRGTYNLVSDLGLGIDATEGEIAAALLANISTADNNDYAFVQIPTSAETPAQIARTDRYKFNGTVWAFEYTLNTSGFTADQWAAINSGVTDTLVAELANIANLIPSEASQYNKLADKVYVITQIIAHIADFKGEYETLLELQSVLNPKPGDLGIVRTKDNDGKDVYTFYQYKDSLWNEYYTLSYHPQIKPATTGTTGDYPYNGMGRVELPMNMVNDVNTLTQDMFYKGTVGFREPNTNTIFVIRYDFTLGEDITIPANCVLEFDGGSISGEHTLTGSNTGIEAGTEKIFGTDVTIVGTWSVNEALPMWWGAVSDNVTPANISLNKCFAFCVLNSIDFDGNGKKYIVDNSTTSYGHFGVFVPGAIAIRNLGLKLKQGSVDFSTLMICQYDDNDYIIENCSFEGELRTPSTGMEDGGNHGIIFYKTNNTFPSDWQDAGDITIRNCKFNNIQSYGIFPTPIKGKLIVEDCDFKCHACGILSYAVNCEIRNCTYTYLESQGTTIHCLAIDEIEQFSSPTAYKKNISIINCKAPEIYHLMHNPQSGVIYGNINIIGCECNTVNISYTSGSYITIDRIFIKDSIFKENTNINNIQNTNLVLENTEFRLILYTKETTGVNITAINCIFSNRYWVHGSTFGIVRFDNCYIKHNSDNTDGFFNTRWGAAGSASKIIFNNCITEENLVYLGFSGPIYINGLTMLAAVTIVRNVNEECYISGLICAYSYGSNYVFIDCGSSKIVVSGLVKNLPVSNSSGVVDLTQKV